MKVFNGDYQPEITTGLMNLNSIRQMIFCIAQNDSSTQELDAFTLLGVSNLLEDAGMEIEQAYDEVSQEWETMVKRHRKLRAALSAYIESHGLSGDSDLARILDDDDQEVGR